jgi:hypothetical protein
MLRDTIDNDRSAIPAHSDLEEDPQQDPPGTAARTATPAEAIRAAAVYPWPATARLGEVATWPTDDARQCSRGRRPIDRVVYMVVTGTKRRRLA